MGSENVSAQNHLRGSYSLLASCPNGLGQGLIRAGFWNYLREDITVALMEKRMLIIELNERPPPLELDGEDDFANHITYILGRIINCCLHKDGTALNRQEWESLKEELESWKLSLPASFEPIFTPRLYGESRFPSVWNTSKWHSMWQASIQFFRQLTIPAFSLHYYHTAIVILLLAEPISPATNTLQQIERMKSIEGKLEYHAVQVCALAISSNAGPVWVNAFGPISFCWFCLESHCVAVLTRIGGPWLRQSEMLTEIANELTTWGGRTGWPVSNIVKSLEESSRI